MLVPAIALAGCIDATTFASHNVEVRAHRALPSSGVTAINVENVAGAITVIAWDRPSLDISSLTYGADQAAVNRTHVTIQTNGPEVDVKTRYDRENNFFGNNNGAEVDYMIRVPKNLNVTVTNVSGPTTVTGVSGDLSATEVSGRLDASLGAVTGNRRIEMTAVSGRITARIARSSSARVSASTISGPVDFFFPADTHHGFVGSSASGRLGGGTATMTLHTVSGPIAVEPE